MKILTRNQLTDEFYGQAANFSVNTEVFSDGPIEAAVAFVGEGPGEKEVAKGLPFVGPSGKLLWEATRKYGFDRETVYSTNVVKRQISQHAANPVHKDELAKWIELVRWELSQLPNVKTIFVLGNYALEALTDCSGISKWRGSVLSQELPNGRAGRVVCTFNPAYVLPNREPRFEPFFLMDCRKLDLVVRGAFKAHHINKIINPTFRESMVFIRDLRKAKAPIGFDIEAINGEMACVGLSNDPHRAMCINFRDIATNRFSVGEEADIFMALQDLFDSNSTQIVAQNGQFDAYFSWMHQMLRVPIWFDILLAHHTLYPRLPHSLGFMTAQYTTHPFYKDEGKEWREGGDIDSYWEYNCCDTAITVACYEKLWLELKQTKLDSFFFNHVMRAQPHLIAATVHGVAVDKTVKDRIVEQVGADVDTTKAQFHELVERLTGDADYKPNPNSWPQIKELFFDVLKLEGRGQSTDEDNRKEIMKNPKTSALAREMLTVFGKFKEEDKFFGTYAKSRVSEDGRFRCEYKQYGVTKAPGRLSSSKLLVEKEGGNMQNQPVRARAQYIADPGCVFLYFDLAQAEAQVVSFRADIAKWKQQFALAKKDGKYDCHRALASEMFKVQYELVPTNDWDEDGKPTIRYVAKRCRHGLNYRMERFRLSQVTELPYHEAARAFMLYHEVTPELGKWWDAEEKQFRKTHEIYNGLGRRFKVIQRIDDSVLESIIAFYPQSTIGDKITETWYRCEEDDKWPHDARIAIDVHDNLVAIAKPKVAKTALAIMKRYAESPIWIQDVYNRREPEPLSIPAELKISYPSSWDEKTKKFVRDDKDGLHRWSSMEKVKL